MINILVHLCTDTLCSTTDKLLRKSGIFICMGALKFAIIGYTFHFIHLRRSETETYGGGGDDGFRPVMTPTKLRLLTGISYSPKDWSGGGICSTGILLQWLVSQECVSIWNLVQDGATHGVSGCLPWRRNSGWCSLPGCLKISPRCEFCMMAVHCLHVDTVCLMYVK